MSEFKYYKGESECPFKNYNDGFMWEYEKQFSRLSPSSQKEWYDHAKECRKDNSLEEKTAKATANWTDEKLGLRLYIFNQFTKWNPYSYDVGFIFKN